MSEHKEPSQRKHFWEHPAATHDPYPNHEVAPDGHPTHLKEKAPEAPAPVAVIEDDGV